MKKLALVIASLALAAAPALACPNMDSSESHDQAPRTAEKDKAPAKDAKGQDQTKAKEAPKAKPEAKPDTKTAKQPAKPEPKKPDKVSSK
jgi:cobalamin biosynthesis protein CobT